jgi:hypothetical protein
MMKVERDILGIRSIIEDSKLQRREEDRNKVVELED